MALHKEQFYQQRIAALEAYVVDFKAQLVQRDLAMAELRVQFTWRDATIAAIQQQVAELSRQVVYILPQGACLSKNPTHSSKSFSCL